MDRILDQITSIYYPIFFIFSIFLQFLLFFLIFTKTSKALRPMRYFLYPSNFTNAFLTILIYFLQFRNVNNVKSMAIMCQGPCKFLGPEFCFHGYILILATATVAGCLNIHTLYYRLVTIKYFDNRNFRRILIFCGWYSFPILIIVLSYIPPINLSAVYLETLSIHSEYNFEIYNVFGGFANSHHPCMTLVTLTLVVLASIAPTLGYYWRREALKILDDVSSSLSQNSTFQFRALIHGLGLQIMLPLFCYVPVAFFYIYNKYSGSQMLISQYTLGVMMTLPAAIDPILQILFIVPYRRAVKSIITCQFARKVERSESVRVNTITLLQRRKSSQPRNIAGNGRINAI